MTQSTRTDALLEAARAHAAAGDFREALDSLSTAIEAAPASAPLHHERGWIRAHLGDLDGELADWSRAIELDPDFAAAHADRSVARAALRDDAGALADLRRAIELDPGREAVLGPIRQRLEARDRSTSGAVLEQGAGAVVDRRAFLRALTGTAAAAIALAPSGCASPGHESDDAGRRWGMVIDLRRCVGCKACTVACKSENHTPPGVAYNVVMEEEVGEFPHVTRRFLPRPCMHCQQPSCTDVCPTAATYRRRDGIVLVDYDRCIGCRYCIAACPYGARSFDFGHDYQPGLSLHERQPSPELGEHRSRAAGESPIGNVRKCTFCLHRVVNSLAPACATTCMGHAIHFGDLADPDARCMVHGENLQELLRTRSHMRLKEELGNEPSVYYLT